MIELLSCADETILHEFPTLVEIQNIKHTNDSPNDLYFFGEGRHFLHYNQFDLKLFTYRAQEFRSIRKYRKTPREFTCFACIKSGEPIFAAGTESGKINFYNGLKPVLDVERSFSSSVPVKVVDLDYSYCSKYVSAVYDDGRINVFGLQTSVKLNELPVDQRHIPMVARFLTSPNIKLAVGSYTGKFTVHDLVAKVKIFESTTAHKDLCCDIICPIIHPNLIISAGECTINLYDIRRKKCTTAHKVLYPLSSISLSHCGTYLAAGDKVGEISGFDMRNMKLPLISKRVSKRSISRVAFVPPHNETKTKACAISDIEICESENSESFCEDRATNENENPDSFFMDFGHANPRISDVLSDSNFSMRINRYSMDFESMSLAGHNTREILTEVSNQQSENLNSSFVTHRRKTKIIKSIPTTTLLSDVIKEEPETVDDFKIPKIPNITTKIKNDTSAPNLPELAKINSKLAALGSSLADMKTDIDDLCKLGSTVEMYSIMGVTMRNCRDVDLEHSLETKLQLVDFLGHGEIFQQQYSEMIEEKEQDSLWLQKTLHPRMFQN